MKSIGAIMRRITLVIVFPFPLDVASEGVGDFKHDDHLEP